MSSPSLSITRLVKVSVNLAPAAAQIQNLSNLLILGTSTVIDVVQRIREYTSIDQVAADFGTSAPEYLAAVLWFEQNPQPTTLLIGRWAQAASHGQLFGGGLTPAAVLTALQAVSTGSLHIGVDAGPAVDVTGLDFHLITNLNGAASVLQTGIATAFPGTTVTWDSVNSRFVVTSSTTGTTSTVTFASVAGAGVDVSGTLGLRSTSSGAYQANGIAAESAVAAVTLFDAQYGQTWYAVQIPAAIDSDHLAVAAYIEAAATKHLYAITTQEAGVLSAVSTTDIAYELAQLKYNRTVTQYSSTNPYAIASFMARTLTVDYTGQNTVIALMYKQEPGITPENLTATSVDAAEAKNCNLLVAYNNNTAIIERGQVASGLFVDEITGTDWLALAIQTAVYNLLYLSPTKVPQTDAGMHLIATTVEAVCSQAVTNGLLAPGTWTSGGFGAIVTGQFLPKGFYVFAPPVATQSTADRAARKSTLVQVAAKLAGAVQTVNIAINVNQ
jgi:Protein of unknown function (DUF3383)